MATKTVQDLALESTPAGGDHVIIDDGTTTRKATVASVVSAGVDLSAVAEDILPDTDDVRSLGSAAKTWKDVYVGPGSLYVNGQKVLEDSAGTIIVSADVNQNLDIKTTGTGDIGLTTAVGGKVEVGGTLEIAAGKNITSSDGNAISFTNGLDLNGEAITNVAAGSLDAAALTGTLPAISGASLTGISIPTLDAPSITGTLSVDSGGTVSHTISNWSDDVTYVVTPTNCTIGAINSSGVFVVTHTSGNPSYTIVATTDSLGLDNSSTVTKNIVMNLSAPTLSSPADVGTATDVVYTITSTDSNDDKIILDMGSSNFTYSSVSVGTASKVGNTVECIGFTTNNPTVTIQFTAEATYSVTAKSVNIAGTYGDSASSSADSITISNVSYVAATGGTVTTDGDYKVHTFTGSGSFVVSTAGDVDYLVIAGGGGGNSPAYGGAGGAGGYRNSYNSETSGGGGLSETSLTLSATTYSITVGAGGSEDAQGSDSIFSTVTSTGGGYGGQPGGNGGSGGGGGHSNRDGGSGTANQGYAGGYGGVYGNRGQCGGGGGAGSLGGGSADSPSYRSGDGGNGLASSITGSSVTRAGGGAGGSEPANGSYPDAINGIAGSGGGGEGEFIGTSSSTSGATNTGSGGGAGSQSNSGGSGIVIIRYQYQ